MPAERITIAICRECWDADELDEGMHVDFAGEDSDCACIPQGGGWRKMVKRRAWICMEPYDPVTGSPCGATFKTRAEAAACGACD